MRTRIVLYGAGGLGRAAAEVIRSYETFELVGFLDDHRSDPVLGVPVVGRWDQVEAIIEQLQIDQVLVSLGDGYADLRWRAFEQLQRLGCAGDAVADPRAVISDHATINLGSIVLSLSAIGQNVRIGRNCVLYSGCVLQHDDVLGDNVYLSPSVTLCGYVSIGDHSFVGAGAVVAPDVRIGTNVTIGAGALVLQGVPDSAVVVGNPARQLRSKSRIEYY